MIASGVVSAYQYIMTSKVLIGSDHGGFALKSALLAMPGIDWQDCGTHSADMCDYPPIAHAVCQKLLAGQGQYAVLICGTGVGIGIAANRHVGIRAALCTDVTMARLARAHNDANVLTLGGRLMGVDLAIDIVQEFLATPFSGVDRYIKRNKQLEDLK